MSSDTLTLRILDAPRRAEARDAWRALESALPDAGLSCGWTWTGTWLEHYGDVVPHRFALAERDGDVCGAALITAPRSVLRPRTVHLGTSGEPRGASVYVEHNRLLAAEGDRAAFARALLDSLTAVRGWDRLRVDGLRHTDAEALLAAAPNAVARVEDDPLCDLPRDGDVLDALSSGRRRRARQTLRAFGPLEVEWAESADAALAVLDELIPLHQAHWRAAGEPGVFASPRFTAFHRALVERLVPEGRAALLRVRRGSETVGCLYGLVDGDRLLFYQGGLRRYDDNRLRAGVAAHVAFMRACAERGLATYHFLAPASRYKTDLSTRAEPLVWLELERPTWRTRLGQARRRARTTP